MRTERAQALINALVAVTMAAGAIWVMYIAHEAHTTTKRHVSAVGATELRRAAHVDSGAIKSLIAMFYFAPGAVLFACASLLMWRRPAGRAAAG
jgi:hypothetical protein